MELRRISNLTTLSSTKRTSASAETRKQGKGPAASIGPDSFSLTDTATALNHAEQSLAATPIVDVDQVSELSAALNNGAYEINSEKVADKIIQLENEIPG